MTLSEADHRADMANVGEALMEAIGAYGADEALKGWYPADCPSEIVGDLICKLDELRQENIRLRAALNNPEIQNFAEGVNLEAAHQRIRWGNDHDAGKSPFDWFWLIGFLAQKAASSAVSGDTAKALHHTISTAAALANWHLALSDHDTKMRSGIATPASEVSE